MEVKDLPLGYSHRTLTVVPEISGQTSMIGTLQELQLIYICLFYQTQLHFLRHPPPLFLLLQTCLQS